MKLLVQTMGPFSLYDPYNMKMIRKNGYTVVEMTPFVQQQRAYQLETIAELPDKATDEEWLEYVKGSDGDLDLAKAAYMASFEDEPAAPPVPTKRPYNRKKDL